VAAASPRWLSADAPATAPATSAAVVPATAPTTAAAATSAAASKPAGPATVTVKRGSFALEVRAETVFVPADPFEVKPTFKQYTGPLQVVSVVPPGSAVRKDQPLITFDRAWYDWQLSAAEGELNNAKANLAKGLADAEVAKTTDPLSLRVAEDALKNAEAAKKWWEEVDGPQMLLLADLQAKQAQYGFEDRNDELEQLRKMYGAEELTKATADIVIRRSVRALDMAKVGAKMEQERRDKTKSFDYAVNRQKVTDAAEQAKHQLQLAKNSLAQTQVARSAGLALAKSQVEQSTRKLAELTEDAQHLQVKSPSDGVVQYGNIADGAWTGGDPKLFKAGERLAAGTVLMRVYKPGKLRLTVALPEAQALWVEQGMTAKVTPAALPQAVYSVPVGAVDVVSRANPAGIGWQVNVDVENPDPRLIPGMKATVVIDAGKVEDGVVVPIALVAGGKAKVKQKDGTIVDRVVKTGKTDGTQVEVISGLSEGDEVVTGKK
ncbi:MAG TPA: efflux RND transporter periplasmic adaptor subunit, partial [Humisphaera sp.]